MHVVQLATYGDCCLAVSAEGGLFGWGNSEYLQLASVTDSTQVCGRLRPGWGIWRRRSVKGVYKKFFSKVWPSGCEGLATWKTASSWPSRWSPERKRGFKAIVINPLMR